MRIGLPSNLQLRRNNCRCRIAGIQTPPSCIVLFWPVDQSAKLFKNGVVRAARLEPERDYSQHIFSPSSIFITYCFYYIFFIIIRQCVRLCVSLFTSFQGSREVRFKTAQLAFGQSGNPAISRLSVNRLTSARFLYGIFTISLRVEKSGFKRRHSKTELATQSVTFSLA